MVKISFTGDAMCEGSRLKDHVLNNGDFNFDCVFDGLQSVIEDSDYVVANLETPLAGESMGYTNKNYSFNTPSSFASALKKSGINMVTTANNHVLDRGIDGLLETLKTLDQIGLDHTGSFANKENNRPLIVNIGDMRVGFLSYTYGTEACFNGFYLNSRNQYMVNLLRNQELSNPVKRYFLTAPSIPAKGFRFVYRCLFPKHAKIDVSQRKENDKRQLEHLKDDIVWCKENANYTIMCLHVGGQFNAKPTEYSKRIAEFCIANGVDAVVGNHEHIIHPLDFIAQKPVAYCLGNLTSDYGIRREAKSPLAEYSAILHLYIEDGKLHKLTFSIVKSIELDGRIVCVSVYDLINSCKDEDIERLNKEVKMCVRTLMGTIGDEFEIQREYEIRIRG